MKKVIVFFCVLFLLQACGLGEECIERTGTITMQEFRVDPFSKIIIFEGISAEISQGDTYKVVVKTGANLMGKISVTTKDGQLQIKDKTECNWTRPYGQTTVYITAPNLEEINCKTSLKIKSNGVLTYPILRLFSMDLTQGAGTGDFEMQLDNQQTIIESNNISSFYLSGKSKELHANFYYGNGKLKGNNLICDTIHVFHRGTNDMEVYPLYKIQGNIYSTGNILLKNTPPIIQVNELYRGKLLYD